jgi:hypothetical protein
MAASGDSLTFIYQLYRARGFGSKKDIEGQCVTADIKSTLGGEAYLQPGQTKRYTLDVPAQVLVIMTPKPLRITINGGKPEVCGSVWIAMDVEVIDVLIENVSAEAMKPEVWLLSTRG